MLWSVAEGGWRKAQAAATGATAEGIHRPHTDNDTEQDKQIKLKFRMLYYYNNPGHAA